MHLKRHSLTLIILTLLSPLFGQFNTYSPYTRFALGDLAKNGTAQNLAMGGTGLAIHSDNRVNYLNPAASAALDSTSVYFDFGANAFFNQYSSGEGSNASTNTWINMNLHHVAFSSSMGKYFGLSAGLVPYSSIGYNIKQEFNDYPTGTAMDAYYKGDGGIMNFFLGASIKLFERVSLGVSMNYLMGKITRQRSVDFPSHTGYSMTSTEERFDLRKPVFTFGLQYHEIFNDKFFVSVGGIYDIVANPDATLQYDLTNQIHPQQDFELDSATTITSAYPLRNDTTDQNFTIPKKIGVGLAFGIPNKLSITGDYYLQDWSGSMSGDNYRTTASSSFHFGLEYQPDYKALRGYHKLVSYRLGAYYTDSYLSVLKPGTTDNYYQLSDYGITFGLGLPVRTLRSSFNLAFSLGTRGTEAYNLVKENYGIVTFNITLHDLWFRKRKFD